MSVRAQLRAQLARYDEDALVAWGNRGLLRRAGKDLEAQPPVVEQDDDQALVLALAGHRQRFDARGPAQASCSCPASGVCQHLLAAVLWLQRAQTAPQPAAGSGAAATGAQAGADPTLAEEPRASLHAELLSFTAAQLARHAGKPGYRWAWQYVQDRDPGDAPRIGGERNVVIDLGQPRIVFRYLGGGLDQMIADSAVSRIEKYRVAAVLAYQHAHGQAIAAPEAPAATAGLDLGKDHALGQGRDEARHDSRERLRASAARLLGECIELGLSHLSRQVHERYATLAVWAQGADYPRLALLLRRIADHVELLLERAGGADEHRLLEELALAHALVAALAQAERSGAAPAHLVGRARSEFEKAGALELWGLGALPWRAASGYVGLTLLFWAPGTREFVGCADARPESQRFDPRARYQAPGPWAGLGAPALATGRRLRLLDAQSSAAGRLSASGKTVATVQAALSGTELLAGLAPCDSWTVLVESRRAARLGLLSEPQPMRDWTVLRPARYGRPRFDAARQTLVWPLYDVDGQAIEAEIAYSEHSAHAIERIEAMAPNQADGQWLIARLRSGAQGLVAEPLSLLRVDAGDDRSRVDALYFDPPEKKGVLGAARGVVSAMRRSQPAAPARRDAPNPVPSVLADYRDWLERRAERGVGEALRPKLEAELAAHVERLRAAGLTMFAVPPPHADLSETMLRHRYLQMQYVRVMGGDDLA